MIFSNRLIYMSFLSLAVICLLAVPNNVRAEEPTEMPAQKASIPAPTSISAIETTIRDQLSAIKNRDAMEAFAFMTDESHDRYETSKDFLTSMRFEYGPIYNHDTIEFLDQYHNDRISVQKIQVTDRYSGDAVTVIYKLELQNSGNWLIDSITILDREDAMPI